MSYFLLASMSVRATEVSTMRRKQMATSSLVALAIAAGGALFSTSAHAAVPHRSERYLPSSNGHSSIAFDTQGGSSKIDLFLEHPYAYPSSGVSTRNFVYDSYPGIRVGTSAVWNNTLAPSLVEMIAGTGIVHVVRAYSGVQLDEYYFTPMGLAETASVMLMQVTRVSGSAAVDTFGIFNFHLGSASTDGSDWNLPGSDNETISYDGTRDAFYETGPAAVAFAYGSIGPSTHHSTDSVFNNVNAGSNLDDNAGTGGPTNDAVPAFQTTLSIPSVGSSAWAGWFTIEATDANGAAAAGRVRTWINGRSAAQLLSDEQSGWSSWITAPPASANAFEATLDKQAQAEIRMAQVSEPGASDGQIMASISPGQWNITWVRDMAYATVALAKSGHFSEAKRALAFQMGATVGGYQTEVGMPYQISVVRYFGNGTEESDSNANGPNIEFDGFGLFLWSLHEYVKASGDTATLTTWWPVVQSKVADVLVHLQESSGLIAADSSIWEVHWNGQQKHFAYTTIAAANGLCAAADLATMMKDTTHSATYLSSGQKARDAILTNLRAPDGTIGQATESLAAKTSWLDAAAIEAVNFGLIDPTRHTAAATLSSMKRGLVPPSGQGFMRNDDGAYYDSQEWVFVDFRATHAMGQMNDSLAPTLFAWNVAQATDNFLELSELHDATTADYAGASPMIGFGAGAYLLSLLDRGVTVAPACESFASEPGGDLGTDGGILGDGGITPGGPNPNDGGANGNADTSNPGGGSGCACAIHVQNGSNWAGFVIFAFGALSLLRRRSR
jgi:GH15 family glucan-1,4-alpha-glucosidase